MALVQRGGHSYGDEQADIRPELTGYSRHNGYEIAHFADAVCRCGGRLFRLRVDDAEGAAVRVCTSCDQEHPIGDSAEYLPDADLEECECPCRGSAFEITAGVALYDDSEDMRWIYLGCRCPNCGLVACYADWKNEYPGYQELLSKV